MVKKYLKPLIRYMSYRKPSEPKLVMTLLVKNEIDIIEANIRTHAMLGVKAFAVMDNGSTDGTREKLDELSREFELLIIDRPDQTYRQAQWMAELAETAADKLGADWVISNDADEFWIPEEGRRLDEVIGHCNNPVLTVKRKNMALCDDAFHSGYRFFDARYCVEHPVYYGNHVSSENVNMILTKISPKTIINPHGLIRLKGGNHKALHVGNFLDYTRHYDQIKMVEGITVFHYPVRSYSAFEANILNRKILLETVPNVKMGNHYRRWVELYREGRLKEEFSRFVLSPTDIGVLKKYGVIQECIQVGETIAKAMGTELFQER